MIALWLIWGLVVGVVFGAFGALIAWILHDLLRYRDTHDTETPEREDP